MAQVKIVLPVTYTPSSNNSAGRSLKMIPVVNCPVIDIAPWIGPSLGLGWNCNRCGSDSRYFAPWEDGDIIPFQIAGIDSANADPTMPTIGLKDSGNAAGAAGVAYYAEIQLLDFDCTTVIYDQADQFCTDYYTSFSDKFGPLQTFFVDTSLFPVNQNVWRVKIITYDSLGAVASESYTEIFKKVRCAKTLLMQSSHAIADCLDHDYRAPDTFVGPTSPPAGYVPTPFYIRWRFEGEITHTGYVNEREVNDNDDVLSIKKRKTFELTFRKIPPYAAEILDTITSVSVVQIDGDGTGFENYQEATDVGKRIDSGTRMFKPLVTVTQICEIDEFECDQ